MTKPTFDELIADLGEQAVHDAQARRVLHRHQELARLCYDAQVQVHLLGGPCVDTAPKGATFTSGFKVTCALCLSALALNDGRLSEQPLDPLTQAMALARARERVTEAKARRRKKR